MLAAALLKLSHQQCMECLCSGQEGSLPLSHHWSPVQLHCTPSTLDERHMTNVEIHYGALEGPFSYHMEVAATT